MNEAFVTGGKGSRKLYGRLTSDEQFTKQIHHLMKLKSEGHPLEYYTDKYNRIRVKHGGTWYVMEELAKHIPMYRVEGL